MLSKRARGYDEEAVPPEKRLRKNIADLFLSNAMSGERAQSLFNDAAAAGASDMRDLRGRVGHNACRNLTTKLRKRKMWPKLYKSEIRVKDPRTDEVCLKS